MIAVSAWFNRMNNGDPLVKGTPVVLVLHTCRAVLVAKLFDKFADGLFKFSVQGANATLIVSRNAIFATSHGVLVDDISEVRQHN